MKNIVVCLSLVFFLFFGSIQGYAYWSEHQTIFESNPKSLSNHEHYRILSTTRDTSMRLVPKGAIRGIRDTDELEVIYEVLVKSGHTIEASVESIKLLQNEKAYDDDYHLVNVDITINDGQFNDTNDYVVMITLTLSLNMPTCETSYLMLVQSQLVYDVVLTAIT